MQNENDENLKNEVTWNVIHFFDFQVVDGKEELFK